MGNSNSNIRIDIEAGVNPAGFNAGVEQIDRVGAAVQRVNQPMVEAERSANKLQMTAGQLSMATQQLPMQFTDIWVSLAAGQNPMMVMLQQGSQIKDSFGGVGAAARAMGGYIAGLVNPITLTTAALAAGAYAWYNWGNSAEEATAKALSNLDKLKKAADAAARPTSQESLFNLKSMAQSAEIEADFYAKRAREDGRSAELKRIDAESAGKARQLAEGLRRQAQEVEDQIAQKAEAESKRNQRGYRQSDAGKAERDYQQVSDAASRRIAVLNAQADATDKLTESERRLIEFDASHQPSKNKAIEQQRLSTRALLEEAAALDKAASAKKASKDAWDESAKVIDKANTSSKEYLSQLQFETSLLGLSTLEVQKRTEARRIDLALERELLALRGNDKLNKDPAALKAAEDAARQAAETAKSGAAAEIEARDRVTKSWEFGSKEAIRKYDEAVKNSAAQSERLYSTAFKSAEDAITKAMMTGKLSVRDFANATIEEFYRIKVAQPMVSAGASFLDSLFNGVFGGGSGGTTAYGTPTTSSIPNGGYSSMTDSIINNVFGGGRASGGPVSPNSLYQINEVGPEVLSYGGNDYLMMGGRGGFVKPLSSQPAAIGAAPAAAPSVVVQVINQSGQNVNARQQGGPQFDGRNWVLGIVLDAADSDPQFRNAMGLGRG